MTDTFMKGSKRPANFTYKSEEAMWHAANSDHNAAKQKALKKVILSVIQERISKEFTAVYEYLNGVIPEPRL